MSTTIFTAAQNLNIRIQRPPKALPKSYNGRSLSPLKSDGHIIEESLI